MKYIRTKDGIYTDYYSRALASMPSRTKDVYIRHKEKKESFEDIAKDYRLSLWTIRNIYGTGRNHVNWQCSKQKKHGHIPDDEVVIQEADTIEELCDEYIVKYRHLYYRNYSLEKAIQKRDWLCKNNFVVLGEKPDIYGAIWTNKGLVYVAKLNEKGELELL